MGLSSLTLFSMLKERIGWLNRRQEVLAQNVANADTPQYKARDLKPFNFKDLIRERPKPFVPMLTSPMHRPGAQQTYSQFGEVITPAPYETSPDGNGVVLEEQMAKIGESQVQHRLTTELYSKNISMIRIALGKGR